MPRSAASLERRRAAHRAWRATPEGRAYYAADRRQHADRERARRQRWRDQHPGHGRKHGVLGRPRRVVWPVSQEPIPALDSHPLVDAALALLKPYERAEINGAVPMDSVGRDAVSIYVLAALEGGDPVAALLADRARRAREREELVHWADLEGMAA